MQFRAVRSWRSLVRFSPVALVLMLAIIPAVISPLKAASFGRLDSTQPAASSVTLEIRPPIPWLMAGEAVTYAIHAAPQGIGTAAAEITLNYGRDLQLVEVKPGPYLGEYTIPGPRIIDTEQGQATYVWARIGPPPDPAQAGVLAYVTFRATPGNPWNTWVRQRVSLVNGQLQVSEKYDSAFHLNVYHRLPVPTGVFPNPLFSSHGARTGPHAAFGVRTHGPGSFRYRIEVSQDNFVSTLHTFDQTISQPGWNSQVYRGGTLARFVSPFPLKPGRYQWRANALIAEVNQWTASSQVRGFEVGSEAMGLDLVSPMTISRFPEGKARVEVEGWGFTPGTGATLTIPGIGATPLEVEWANDARIVVIVPESIGRGLAKLDLRGEDGQVQTSSLLILPPALFTARTDLPRARQVIPGQEFPVQVTFSNLGSNLGSNSGSGEDSMALVAVDLPDSKLFQLVSIDGRDSAEVLDQDLNLILLATGNGSSIRFNFRLPPELAGSPGTAADPFVPFGASLDFGFKPVVLGEVSRSRWEQLQSEPVERQIQAVQEETAQRLRTIARSFNLAPPALLADRLPADSEASAALALIDRLPGNGLAMGGVPGACCRNSPPQLTVVTTIDPNNLQSDLPGFGSSAYITEDQVVNYTIRFENPASEPAPAADLTIIADLGTGIDLASVRVGPSSHPVGMTSEINESNGTITWFFRDIALPPNQSPPEGEGWVRFSAGPVPDAASGTPLSVQAAIRFGYNPAVETNRVAYTIDSGPPATRVNGLAPVQLSPSFEITWAGSDDDGGSGIQGVTLLVSEDGGPFRGLGTFSEQTIPFQGETGKTYGFATLSIDQVGHTEALPDHPDATVTVGQLLSAEPGWQLIGVPVVTAQSPKQLLSRPGTAWSAWDSSEQTYLPVAAGSTDWPAVAFDLAGSGLWASLDAGTSYYITGQPVPMGQPYSIELKTGWNLIANPFPAPVQWDLNAVRVRVAGVDITLADAQSRGWSEDFAWGWNGDAYYLVYDPELVASSMEGSDLEAGVYSELEPFKGYWFQSHQDATLVLPPPATE